MTRRIAPDPLAHQGTLQAHLMLLAQLRSPEKPPGWTWGIFWDKDQDAPDEVEIARLEAHIRGMHGFPPHHQEAPADPSPPQADKPALGVPQDARTAPPEAAAPLTLSEPGQCPWEGKEHLHIVEGDVWLCAVAKGQEDSEKKHDHP